MGQKDDFLIGESGTHYVVRLPVDGGCRIGLYVDKQDFTVTIPSFEYLGIEGIAEVVAKICTNKELLIHPVVRNFLKYLHRKENKEELELLQTAIRGLK